MKIYGPYTRADGRKHIIKYDPSTGSRKTVSYPKHLMEKYLGRALLPTETVDHIDDNFYNDDINNLQVISRGANVAKACITGDWYVCNAYDCTNQVWRPPSVVDKLKIGVFCCNSCRSATLGNQYQQGV